MTAVVIIPAIKKNVAFTDDLVKKLNGISLIQRTIDKASEISGRENIYVVTDSSEIRLICQRNKVKYFFDESLRLRKGDIVNCLRFFLSDLGPHYSDIIILSPYSPMVNADEIRKAFEKYKSGCNKLLIPVKRGMTRAFNNDERDLSDLLFGEAQQELLLQCQAFRIFNKSLLMNGAHINEKNEPLAYELDSDLLEIHSYQDWWVCEKLLKRKIIVFRIVGTERGGMGHIYRALTLAHEITDHEVRFVCDENSQVAVKKLAGYDYWLGVYKESQIVEKIIAIRPSLVINDILNTDSEYICKLKKRGIKVINFEDLGSGAPLADLTFNELYDDPSITGENILWGRDYFFVREEFNDAKPNKFKDDVKAVLVAFGGTDPNNFTRKILWKILEFCVSLKIKIYVVTGGGYPHIKALEKEIDEIENADIEYIHATGVMSHIMEQVQIAISSNGRTAYELAHMNIPSIIISHHERENTHAFVTRNHGYVPLGLYRPGETENQVLSEFQRLVTDRNYRRDLFDQMEPFEFCGNKEKVLKKILNLLDN